MELFIKQTIKWVLALLLLFILSPSCGRQPVAPVNTVSSLPAPPRFTATQVLPSPSTTSTPIMISTPTPVIPTATSTHKPTTEADGCRKPSEDYERLTIHGFLLNRRTYEMLAYAASLYDGVIEITGSAITQGSYTRAVEASFGTHAGGGAVDISVMAPGTYTIIDEDIEPLIEALRLAGFAAWYRDFDQLYDGSPVHIHAIAIGDKELSFATREQLTGPHGYFWGFDGLPVTQDRLPGQDPHGGPIICDWMIDLGYPNQTATPPSP